MIYNVVDGVLTLEEAQEIDRAILCQKICVETVYEDDSDDDMDYAHVDEEVDDGNHRGHEERRCHFEIEEEEDDDEEEEEMEEDRIKEGSGEGDVEVIGRSEGGRDVGMNDVWEYDDIILECRNCRQHWPDLNSIPSIITYEMVVGTYKISDLVPWLGRLKFACIMLARVRNLPDITLCRECASFLVDVPVVNGAVVNRRGRGMVNKWLAFVGWRLLSNEEIIEEKGTEIWSYVPDAWRAWWINKVREREIFSDVTLTNPPSIFKDVTMNRKEFLGSLKCLELANLMECCDKHLSATVRCPWGCTKIYIRLSLLRWMSCWQDTWELRLLPIVRGVKKW
jgi:hypothetical protein